MACLAALLTGSLLFALDAAFPSAAGNNLSVDAGSGLVMGSGQAARQSASVSFASGSFGVEEIAGPASITVTLDAPLALTVSVPITDNNIYQTTETIGLALVQATNASLAPPIAATLATFVDESLPSVPFSSASYSALENGGPAELTMPLSDLSAFTVTVNVSATFGTTGTSHFTPVNTNLNFAPGNTSLTVTVPINDVVVYTGDRIFTAALSLAGNTSVGAPSSTADATDTSTPTTTETAASTASSTATSTSTETPTASEMPTIMPAPARRATSTPTGTDTATATATDTATPTITPTPTASPSATASATATATATIIPTQTATATQTPTHLQTATPTGTASNTATPMQTATKTPSPTATATATSTSTRTPTSTGTATATHSPTGTATSTANSALTPTATLTPRTTATASPSATASPAATAIARAGCVIYPSGNVPRAIPDNNPAGIDSLLLVPGPSVPLYNIGVRLNDIRHDYVSDLIITLIAPDGTQVTLANRVGADSDNFYRTVLYDGAAMAVVDGSGPFTGEYRPDQPLASLNGYGSAGTWRLNIADVAAADSGTLYAWALEVCTADRLYMPFFTRH